MKLASLKSGRDGLLVVVSKDLSWCADATDVAPTLQAALDDWDELEGPLREFAARLERGDVERMAFDETMVHSPLPRASRLRAASSTKATPAAARTPCPDSQPGRLGFTSAATSGI